MKVSALEIADLKLIEMRRFPDERGYFVERFNQATYVQFNLQSHFVQDNHSLSKARVLRGLHFQYDPPQGKLVGCIRGKIWDVAVDLRWDSPTYGRHVAVELSSDNGYLLWIPPGFAHGFCVLGDEDADVIYKVDTYYNGRGESAIHWQDSQLKIPWPIDNPILSAKDEAAGPFAAYEDSPLRQTKWWS